MSEVSIIWRDIPEINRKIALQVSYNTYGGGLGCHAGTISGVNASFGYGMYAPNGGRSIEVLDTTKEPELMYTRQQGHSYRNPEPPVEESKKVLEYIKTHDFNDVSLDAYRAIVDVANLHPIWILSDVVNRGSKVRENGYEPPPRGSGAAEDVFYYIATTAGFVKYLIDKKIGYVLTSPIVQNPAHRMDNNYSLNQVWVWIPPNHLNRTLSAAAQHGEDRLPSKEDWAKVVSADFESGVKDPVEYCTRLFADSRYPENRFRTTKE